MNGNAKIPLQVNAGGGEGIEGQRAVGWEMWFS